MPISTELTRMAQNVGALAADTSAIFEALRAKGVAVPADAQLSDVMDMIESIVLPHQNEVEIGGRWYPYVQIGNQLWLTKNLDWKFDVNGSQIPIGSSGAPTTPAAWYRDNEESSYGLNGTYKCGLMYNWYAVDYLETNKSTMLPSGWRVSSSYDWTLLSSAIGGDSNGSKLNALANSITSNWPSDWGTTDEYGFSALPYGQYYNSSFVDFDNYAVFWTSTQTNKNTSYRRALGKTSSILSANIAKGTGCPIRLVKDVT